VLFHSQELSRPLVTDLRLWFEAQLKTLPPRGPMAKLIRYPLNHWNGLEQFLSDGRIEIDNDTVERSMRPKNYQRKIRSLRVPMRAPITGQPLLY
jgi:hypothetical protein